MVEFILGFALGAIIALSFVYIAMDEILERIENA